jgi:Domain of unknown function (DUF4129)
LTRAALLILVLWWIGGSDAAADTISLQTYRARLQDARSFVQAARTSPRVQQPGLLGRAALLLRGTDAVRLADGSTISVDDATLAARVSVAADDTSMQAAIVDLDARIAMVDGASASRPSGSAVDARLREVTRPRPTAADDPGLGGLFLVLVAQVLLFIRRGALSAIDPYIVIVLVAGLGLGTALLVFGILGRGLRERIRREVQGGGLRAGTAEDPSAHLARADAAMAAGRPRDALHELYLFALVTLAAHETIRFDPALTDRELLARAAAIPQIGPLRDLVALHERVWFGLKPADGDDAARARELAQRVAA